jgi:hypothetical protein
MNLLHSQKFDVSIFSKISNEPQIYFNDKLDISPLKLLYDNCIIAGNVSNNNIQMATVHPDLWFGDYFDFFREKVKMVVKSPIFQLIKIEGNQLVCEDYTCDSISFNSDDDLMEFMEKKIIYGSIAIFYIVKWLNVKTLVVTWNLRYKDLTTKEEIRDNKINNLVV